MSADLHQSRSTGGLSSRDTEATYRPVSQTAVVALIFGIVSLSSFVGPPFWASAGIALVFCAWTSYKLERAREEYAGQFICKAGAVLSLVSLVAAPTRYYTQKWIVTREAVVVANEFVDFVLANRIRQAFYLTLSPFQKTGADESKTEDQHIDDAISRAGERYRMFLTNPLRSQFGGRGADAQVTYLGAIGYGYSGGMYDLALHYKIGLDGREPHVLVFVKGAAAGQGEWQGRQWYVDHSEFRDQPPNL